MIEDFERFVMKSPAQALTLDTTLILIIVLVSVISFAIGFITAWRMK